MTSSLQEGGAANPVAGVMRRATQFSARLNGWMRRWSWAVAMTVVIVITVGGLVILESGRMRIAAEYETALDAKGATTQLTALAADIASLTADERAFRLAPDNTYTADYNAAARIRQTNGCFAGCVLSPQGGRHRARQFQTGQRYHQCTDQRETCSTLWFGRRGNYPCP